MNKKVLIWLFAAFFIAGCLYLANNTRIFSDQNIYYGYYQDVRGLQESSPVYLMGVKVGRVDEIDLNIKEKVRVVFEIDKEIKIPEGSKMIITTGDISGGKSLRLEMGNGKTIIPSAGILETGFDSTMTESFHSRITPMLHAGKVLLHSADSLLFDANKFIRQGWGNETRKSFANINNVLLRTATFSGKGNQAVQHFQKTLNKLDSATKDPQFRNQETNKSLANTDKQVRDAAKNNMIQNLREIDKSISRISASINKAQQNKLLNDTQNYQQMSKSLDTFNRSTQQYMKDPAPLINIGFGGKKK